MLPKKYNVQRLEEEAVSPEETLLDTESRHSAVELPISRNVVRALYGIVGLVMLGFLVQAFQLQIVEGKTFALLADQSRFNRYPVPSLRGVIYDRNGKPIVENEPVFDLVAVRSELNDEELLEGHQHEGVFVVKKNIPKEEAIRLQVAEQPGLYVATYARRSYVYGKAFGHVAGYTSQVTPDDILENDSFHLQERTGRIGLEAFYDSIIRGEGYEIFLNPETIRTQSPISGQSIFTTLDIDVQLNLFASVDAVFRSAGVRRGAAIVQNVKTGEVLGIVSMPTFDPNDITGEVLQNQDHPLFNRVISGLYSPGSTIKPLYALVGLTEGVVNPSTTIFADGAIEVQSEVDSSQYFTFRDWKVHGWTDIYKAIADSVDVYFYALGGGYGEIRGVGIDVIEKYLRSAHADQKTGIDLPFETKGFVPSKKWKRETKNDSWYIGDTYNVSIGQGDLLVTPLWLNTYIGAIANGGKLMKPYIVQSEPEVVGTLPFDEKTMAIVRKGMRQTITDGTGQLLKDLPKPVAAKTGTAQVTGRGLNSLFVVYGPTDDPEIVMTILVENIPQSQSLAMQVARQFLMWYFTR
ncbi:MAG: penicillin-binding transpeptidase domain-containing protein [Patescibacteria group bacterium]